MDSDYMLSNDVAKRLFKEAKKAPIIDFHNHLDPKEIYEDRCFSDITEVWLSGDHYKWRAMRANGVPEKYITGNGDPYRKFLAWADTVENLIGNPLYAWTHLELQRYFDIKIPLSRDNGKEIWEECNKRLRTKEYSVRNLLRMQNVSVLCTTDDPADDLSWHKGLRNENFEIKVLPSFRPDRAIAIEKDGFPEYIKRLSEVSGEEIYDTASLLKALEKRLTYFTDMGCRVSDHSIEGDFFGETKKEDAESILKKRLEGGKIKEKERAAFAGYMLRELGRLYKKNDMVMQLHIGALRNNSKRLFLEQGPDHGFDSLNDFNFAPMLSSLINSMDETDELPKTILYCLNPKDMEMLSAMAGNFCANESGIKGMVQLGTAWWFMDHKRGMEHQIEVVADTGLLSTSVGMLTDSRSFLSFPRHELYRRILCNKIGEWVENGEYPMDYDRLKGMVKNICGNNAVRYFGF